MAKIGGLCSIFISCVLFSAPALAAHNLGNYDSKVIVEQPLAYQRTPTYSNAYYYNPYYAPSYHYPRASYSPFAYYITRYYPAQSYYGYYPYAYNYDYASRSVCTLYGCYGW